MTQNNAYKDASASISTTEYSLVNNSTSIAADTTDGVYQLWLDLNALTATEEYELKGYEKVQGAGTQRMFMHAYILGVQSEANYVSPSVMLGNGWDWTLKKLAGTDRTIGWSIRQVV